MSKAGLPLFTKLPVRLTYRNWAAIVMQRPAWLFAPSYKRQQAQVTGEPFSQDRRAKYPEGKCLMAAEVAIPVERTRLYAER
jgi:hypothetical protein